MKMRVAPEARGRIPRRPATTWIRWTAVSAALLLASLFVAAGEVFGTISENNRPVTNESVTIDCGSGARSARTDEYGSYRLFVGTEGSCKLSVRGLEGATIRSYGSPQRYNFEIRSGGGKATLERR